MPLLSLTKITTKLTDCCRGNKTFPETFQPARASDLLSEYRPPFTVLHMTRPGLQEYRTLPLHLQGLNTFLGYVIQHPEHSLFLSVSWKSCWKSLRCFSLNNMRLGRGSSRPRCSPKGPGRLTRHTWTGMLPEMYWYEPTLNDSLLRWLSKLLGLYAGLRAAWASLK